MYIIYNETKYPCRCKPAPVAINYFDLPEDFPAPVSGTIPLYADDGFLLREDSADAYLRQTFANGHLQLTNVPEPEPAPEPEPDPDPVPDPETEPAIWDELDAAYQKGVDSV